MSRDYRSICQDAQGRWVYLQDDDSWNVNVWGAEFWGRVWETLGLPIHTYLGRTQLPHVLAGDAFWQCLHRLNAISESEWLQATDAVYAAMRVPVDDQMEPADRIACLRDDILPIFNAPGAMAVVSDYVDLDTFQGV